MRNVFPLIALICLLTTSVYSQTAGCALCRQIFTALIAELGSAAITETEMETYLRLGCTSFNLDSWCQQHVYPNMHDIYLALRSNRTDDVICERLALCHFKVVKLTGEVLFADRDRLYTIREIAENKIVHELFGTVSHPQMPGAIVSGLACSVDYCAVLLSERNSLGGITYGTTALSIMAQKHHVLPSGTWYGPWFDIISQEFWIATGTSSQLTFGIFEPQFGDWLPKVIVNLRLRTPAKILSGQILDRVLYFTLLNDNHVFKIDLSIRLYLGNYTTVNNTMLVGNPVTNELFGYSPSPQGIWKYSYAGTSNRTTIANINLIGILPVPASTINPVDNTMWISLWGISSDAWVRVDLKKTKDNVGTAGTGKLDGLFDFNPYTMQTVEV